MPARAKKTGQQKAAQPTAMPLVSAKKPTAQNKRTAVKKAAARISTSKRPASCHVPAPLSIVGIGASAGGFKALENFFAHLPPDSGAAFVVIQHLPVGHKSIMASLLAKRTALKVLPAENGARLRPNCIYLNPPDKNIAVMGGVLQLMRVKHPYPANLPIDYCFRSLAEDQKERAVCIVLSGAGADGALGLKAIKAAGGMTMAQLASDAEYNGMPNSAIATGMVDCVLPADKMPAQLLKYLRHPYLRPHRPTPSAEGKQEDYLQKILALIRTRTGHDFSQYKKNTICRRIERRMALHQIDRMTDYVRLLEEVPSELETLFRDLLIRVTGFFRDPDAFKALARKVLPDLLSGRQEQEPLRIWVPGCATGEDAYSVAMLIAEVMGKLGRHIPAQIFATDIDNEAIEYARMAVYPESIAADIAPERLKNYFIKEGHTYRVQKRIREMVVFASQSLTKDPPFSKLDLLVCRNVLIYMNSDLQKKLFALFHYTLRPGGFLFLGTSEGIGGCMEYFSPVDARWKIFKRTGAEVPRLAEHPVNVPAVLPRPEGDSRRKPLQLTETDIRAIAEATILEKYSPPCVLINSKYDILYFSGNTEKYLAPQPGVPSFNILKMAHQSMLYRLSSALHKAARQKTSVSCRNLQITQADACLHIDVTVIPISALRARDDLMLVAFKEQAAPEAAAPGRPTRSSKKDQSRIAMLEQELQSTKEYLQTTIEELETSNEELKSTNEELQSTNEELQSANEELETSKEEMHSTNEELTTLNNLLQVKVDELGQANDDLNNLLASTEIGTIFLDMNLCIKRFTPSIEKIFSLLKTDIGRPISDLTAKTPHANILADAHSVLRTLGMVEKNIQVATGETFNMRIIPYRTTENVIDGVVITFADITAFCQAREDSLLAAVLNNSNDAVTLQDAEGNILLWNQGAERMYGYSQAEALAMNIRKIIPEGHREEALHFAASAFAGKNVPACKTRRMAKGGRMLNVWLQATILRNPDGPADLLVTIERELAE